MRLRRTIPLMAMVASLFQCTACGPHSLRPWIEKKDAIREQKLMGSWVVVDENKKVFRVRFIPTTRGSYKVKLSNPGEKSELLNATPGKIGDAYYLDYVIPDHPKEGNGSCCSCMHRLARLEIGQDKLSIRVLDAGKLEAALNKPGTKGIEFIMVKQGEGWLTWNDLLIVSQTKEMQNFLLTDSRDSDIWDDPIELTRRR